MKIYSIIAENTTISNAEEFSQSFTDDQWKSIFAYFATQEGYSLGNRRSEIQSALSRLNQELGRGLNFGTSPQTWMSKAMNWGVHVNNPRANWQTIRDFIAPHADFDITTIDKWDDTSEPPVSGQRNTNTNTPETIDELKQGMNLTQEFNNWNEVRTAFETFAVEFWTNNRDAEWNRKRLCTAESGQPAQITLMMSDSLRRVKDAQDGGQTITMNEVVEAFWNWLILADRVFANNNYCPPPQND